jgi:drug/metabolite transporter (DMT)-like permease
MSRTLPGYLALAAAVLIWAGWIVVVRGTVNRETVPLSPLDIAVLRYGVPALVLSPIWLRLGPLPPGLGKGRLAAMVLGWGAPFGLMGATGLMSADTTLFATLAPGGMPLWLALILMAVTRRAPHPRGLAGIALIALGCAGALWVAFSLGRGTAGVPWLLAASFGWACYTAAYRGSGLSPVRATALVALWSTLGLIPTVLIFETSLLALPPAILLREALLQGVLSGVVSVMAFALAIDRLGAPMAAGGAAMVPVLTALGGWWFLGDPIGPMTLGLLGCTVMGVALINTAPARGVA